MHILLTKICFLIFYELQLWMLFLFERNLCLFSHPHLIILFSPYFLAYHYLKNHFSFYVFLQIVLYQVTQQLLRHYLPLQPFPYFILWLVIQFLLSFSPLFQFLLFLHKILLPLFLWEHRYDRISIFQFSHKYHILSQLYQRQRVFH